MHLNVLKAGKVLVESIGGKVVCGLMAPSHHDYLSHFKFPTQPEQILPADLRLYCVQKCVPEWCILDPWEASQDRFLDLDVIVNHHDEVIKSTCGSDAARVKLAMLAGADLAVNMGFLKECPKGFPDHVSVFIYPRSGYVLPEVMPRKTLMEMQLTEEELEIQDITSVSSTKLRNAWNQVSLSSKYSVQLTTF
jgi:hypothetical protein